MKQRHPPHLRLVHSTDQPLTFAPVPKESPAQAAVSYYAGALGDAAERITQAGVEAIVTTALYDHGLVCGPWNPKAIRPGVKAVVVAALRETLARQFHEPEEDPQ